MSTKAYRTWADRIASDQPWEPGVINQWRNTVWLLGTSQSRVVGGKRTNLTEDEAKELVQMWADRFTSSLQGPYVTEAQAQIGRDWLASRGVKFGLPRDVNYQEIKHFTFIGVQIVGGNGFRVQTAPIYVAWWPDGSWLRYWCTPWQTGADFKWSAKFMPTKGRARSEHALAG